MSMAVLKKIELMIQAFESSSLHEDPLKEALKLLHFLKIQCLCDLDRRENEDTLRRQWQRFHFTYSGLFPLANLRKDPAFFREITAFFGGRETYSLETIEKTPNPKSLFCDWNAAKFFAHLDQELQKSAMSDSDRLFARVACRFLESESQRSNTQRDKTFMLQLWQRVHPMLKKAGLLEPYKKDRALKEKIFSAFR